MTPQFRKFLEVMSSILGWTYFVCWSVSFYPQAVINFKRKSVTGLSIDFVVMSFIGFLCYAAYTVCLFWVNPIKEEYRARHDNNDSLVEINDVVFPVHATIITFVYIIQVLIYRKPGERLSKLGWAIVAVFILLVFIFIILGATHVVSWLTFLVVLTNVKLALTIGKYIPQVYSNYVRKSTVGWSILNVMLDFSGGIFSIAQLILDAALSGNWDGIKGYMIKLTLAIVTIFFDTIFLLQHFYWYPAKSGPHFINVVDEKEKPQLMTSVIPPSSPTPSKASKASVTNGHKAASIKSTHSIKE